VQSITIITQRVMNCQLKLLDRTEHQKPVEITNDDYNLFESNFGLNFLLWLLSLWLLLVVVFVVTAVVFALMLLLLR